MEYLNELQKCNKWVKDGPEVKVGAIVLIKSKGLSYIIFNGRWIRY